MGNRIWGFLIWKKKPLRWKLEMYYILDNLKDANQCDSCRKHYRSTFELSLLSTNRHVSGWQDLNTALESRKPGFFIGELYHYWWNLLIHAVSSKPAKAKCVRYVCSLCVCVCILHIHMINKLSSGIYYCITMCTIKVWVVKRFPFVHFFLFCSCWRSLDNLR